MSLKTSSFSGEVKDAAKEISKVANNKDGIAALLNDFYKKRDIKGAGQALGLSGIEKGMAKAGLEASRFGEVLEDVDDAMDIMANTSLKGGKGLKEMGKNLLSMGKGLLKTIFTPKNLGIGALVGGTALFIKKTYDKLPSTLAKKSSESAQQLEIDKTNLEEVNAELEKTKSRIDELQIKGHLSLVEQNELSNLIQQREELERISELKKSQLKVNARDNLNKNKKTYDAYTTNKGEGALEEDVNLSYDKNKIKEQSKYFANLYGNQDRLEAIKDNSHIQHWWNKVFEGASLEGIDPKAQDRKSVV